MKTTRTQSLFAVALLGSICFHPHAVLAADEISRPDEGRGPTRVQITLIVINVSRIDTVEQSFHANVAVRYRWRDPRLAHAGSGSVRKTLAEVWHPRLQFVNVKESTSSLDEQVEVAPAGDVLYRQRFLVTFSQPLRLEDFPFDRQAFTIRATSIGYTPDQVLLVADDEVKSAISGQVSEADWRVTGYRMEFQPYRPVFVPNVVFAGYSFTFDGRRKAEYYVANMIVPLILIVGMAWLVFWMNPQEFSTQISVATTTMLTVIAFRLYTGQILPAISYLTRMDYFVIGSMILVFTSLPVIVWTSTLIKKERIGLARRIELWARWAFPACFAAIILYSFAL